VEKATPMEGAEKIPELLQKKDIRGFIYTNNSQETINRYLEKVEFKFLLKFSILTRDNINNPKPDPEGIFKILKICGIKKENSIYIGDSYIDAGASSKAGIRFILFNSRDLDLKLFPRKPIVIINHWSKFKQILCDKYFTSDNS
jgi:phosphoglycolate phosphatase-like HAD superfamily hydrolase